MKIKITKPTNKLTIKSITMIAMFSAVSAILMVLEFQIPFAPSFAKFDFSDLPVIIGGFLLGPLAGMFIAVMKILLNFLLNGTTTMFVGELSNLILTLAFVLPAAIIYQKNKTKKNAIVGLIVSVLFVSLLAIVSNMYFIFPMYAKLFNLKINDIVQMAIVTNPLVNDMKTMIIFSLLPFNLLKYTTISVLTMISYKKLSYLFKKEL